jgi:hypothetical protein
MIEGWGAIATWNRPRAVILSDSQLREEAMFKRLVGAAAGMMLMTGLASAQTYPPPTTPPEIPAPSMRVPASGTSTTTVAPGLHRGWQATTTRLGLDEHGNPVTQRDIYREGIAGSTENHQTYTTDPSSGGTTTNKTTTTKPE